MLRLLAKGKSMSEIAALINVSYKTVATTCASLRAKFSARTPMQLIRIAVICMLNATRAMLSCSLSQGGNPCTPRRGGRPSIGLPI